MNHYNEAEVNESVSVCWRVCARLRSSDTLLFSIKPQHSGPHQI